MTLPPANQEQVRTPTRVAPKTFRRSEGEALHPAREPLKTLGNTRASMNQYEFAAQFQQAPAPRGGGIVKEEWFKNYDPAEKPENFDRIIQSWDTANKATELNDYSVRTTWGSRARTFICSTSCAAVWSTPTSSVLSFNRRGFTERPFVLIEYSGSGTQLAQELRREGLSGLEAAQSRSRQGRADERTDNSDRGRICLSAPRGGMACRVPARTHNVPEKQVRR
jgi:phage terminase large subunit-like protein